MAAFPRMSFSAANTLDIEADKAPSAGPIPIAVNFGKQYSQKDLLDEQLAKASDSRTPACFYPKAQEHVHSPSWSGVKKNMYYSMWKLNAVAATIRGKSLIEAKQTLAAVDKKGATFVNELLDQVVANGTKRGYNPEQMYVKTITCGGNILFKKPDIKGRGRTGVIAKPISNMRLCLEEKNAAEFYKMTLKGETPAGVAAVFRKLLYQNKADFEHVKVSSHMLTSNGRRYRRVQFQRLVQKVQKEYRQRGITMRAHKIERNLLEKVGRVFVEKKEKLGRSDLMAKKSLRTQHFEKEYKKQ